MEQLQIDYDAIAVEQVIVQVEKNNDEDWKALALEAVRKTCLSRNSFISDDIWEVGNLPSTREDRALGPVLMKASKFGWCSRTSDMRPSKRSHGSGKPVWRSRLL
jgi:hypothetical protein